VTEFGTGALNIDGCRVSHSEICKMMAAQTDKASMTGNGKIGQGGRHKPVLELKPSGRWPANVIFDEEAGKMLDGQARYFYCPKASRSERNAGLENEPKKYLATMGNGIGAREHNPDQPTAWSQNHHPTVKPIKLMEYLVRLVTPPGGTVLDPFMGSGTTGIACKNLGFDFIGIEREKEYVEIAEKRIGP